MFKRETATTLATLVLGPLLVFIVKNVIDIPDVNIVTVESNAIVVSVPTVSSIAAVAGVVTDAATVFQQRVQGFGVSVEGVTVSIRDHCCDTRVPLP